MEKHTLRAVRAIFFVPVLGALTVCSLPVLLAIALYRRATGGWTAQAVASAPRR